MKTKRRYAAILGLKIGFGTALAIVLAKLLNLDQPTSAGTITLLTLLTTKKGTLRLIIQRFLTFVITVFLGYYIFNYFSNEWIAFLILLITVVVMIELLGWTSTISVNAMIAIHLLSECSLTIPFLINEFFLLVIGVLCAYIINLYHSEKIYELDIIKFINNLEDEMQLRLKEIVHYIDYQDVNTKIWDNLEEMEHKIEHYLIHVLEYEENCTNDKADYYIEYFEMREFQLGILQMLHYEIRKIRTLPKQAHIISEYIDYLIPHVKELNDPQPQINKLLMLIEDIRNDELPKTREEFENHAILYHILMDLEDFLLRKQQFYNQNKHIIMKESCKS